MRRFILLISIIFIFNFVFAGEEITSHAFIAQNNIEIPLYSDPLNNKVDYLIFQDSVFEHFYELRIYEETSLRFKVNVICVSQYNSLSIDGWIDKKFCGVYILSNRKNKLYDSPLKDSNFTKINNEEDILAIVIGIDKDFIKIAFTLDGKYNEGWMEKYKYCDNVYGSCT